MKNKKVLILDGSPRLDGFTARLIAALPFTDRVRWRCYDRPVAPCTDCRACRQTGRCAKRDMDKLYRLIEEADVLIFATPLYNDSFPSPLKAVIDRCQVYWARRFSLGQKPPIPRKKQVILLTTGGAVDSTAETVKRSLLPLLTVLNGTLYAEVHAAGTDSRQSIGAEEAQVLALNPTTT